MKYNKLRINLMVEILKSVKKLYGVGSIDLK